MPMADALNDDLASRLFYHYTNSDGLIGILNSEAIRLTNIRYLNDEKEFSYFIEKFEQCFHDVYLDMDRKSQEKCDDILKLLKNVKKSSQLYVASFSTFGDQLSQWRAYGSGSGYSLGFSAIDLYELMGLSYDELVSAKDSNDLNVTDGVGVLLRKVIYDEGKINSSINDLIQQLIRLTNDNQSSEQDEIDFVSNMLSTSCVCKHPSFSEECEWRLIALDDPSNPQKVCLRSGPRGVVPYVEFPLLDNKKKFILKEIFIGPNQHQLEQSNGIELYMKSNQKQMVRIRFSESPFRG